MAAKIMKYQAGGNINHQQAWQRKYNRQSEKAKIIVAYGGINNERNNGEKQWQSAAASAKRRWRHPSEELKASGEANDRKWRQSSMAKAGEAAKRHGRHQHERRK